MALALVLALAMVAALALVMALKVAMALAMALALVLALAVALAVALALVMAGALTLDLALVMAMARDMARAMLMVMDNIKLWLDDYKKREYRERIRVLLYLERDRRVVGPVLKRLITEIEHNYEIKKTSRANAKADC